MIPLINIVFLILIFFLVASTVRPFSDRDLKLAQSSETQSAGAATRMAVVRRDGTRLLAGRPVTKEDLARQFAIWAEDSGRGVTIVADREMPARELIAVVTEANSTGLTNIRLLTRKAR